MTPRDPAASTAGARIAHGASRLAAALRRPPDTRLRAVFVVLYLLLFVGYRPRRLWDPYLFAEEGSIYFRYAFRNGFGAALVAPQLGYYSLLPSVATATATLVPLEYAPFVTLAFSFGVQLLLAALVLSRSGPFRSAWEQGLALAAIALVPPCFGRLDTNLAQWPLCIGAALVLLSSSAAGAGRWLQRGTLVLGGLTGGVTLFLSPLFALRAFWERSRESYLWVGILFVCGLVEIAAVLAYAHLVGKVPSRFALVPLDVLVSIAFNQSVVLLFAGVAGRDAVGSLLERAVSGPTLGSGGALLIGAAAAGVAGLLAAMLGGRRPARGSPTWLLALAFVLVAGLGVWTGTTGRPSPSRIPMISGHDRYFHAPNVFVAFALVLQLAQAHTAARRRAYALLVGWLFASALFVYATYTPAYRRDGPSWRAEVARWRADPDYPIRIWPAGWRLRIPPEPTGASGSPDAP